MLPDHPRRLLLWLPNQLHPAPTPPGQNAILYQPANYKLCPQLNPLATTGSAPNLPANDPTSTALYIENKIINNPQFSTTLSTSNTYIFLVTKKSVLSSKTHQILHLIQPHLIIVTLLALSSLCFEKSLTFASILVDFPSVLIVHFSLSALNYSPNCVLLS